MNKEYQIKYSSLFKKDLEQIIRYLKKNLNNVYASNNLLKEIDKKIRIVAKNPKSYAKYISFRNRKTLYYKLNVKNYVIFYVVKENTIEFRKIIFGRRNFKNLI